LSEQEEIEILSGRAKRRLESAHHLFENDFYEEAVINCEKIMGVVVRYGYACRSATRAEEIG